MGKTDKHRASKFLQWGAVAFFAIYFAFRGVGLWASMVLGAKAILGGGYFGRFSEYMENHKLYFGTFCCFCVFSGIHAHMYTRMRA